MSLLTLQTACKKQILQKIWKTLPKCSIKTVFFLFILYKKMLLNKKYLFPTRFPEFLKNYFVNAFIPLH